MFLRALADLSRRSVRTVLSSLGVAVGVAAVVAVLGVSATASGKILASIDNLQDVLTVTAGTSPDGGHGLPSYSVRKAGELQPVLRVAGIKTLSNWSVYRNNFVPSSRTGSIETYAVSGDVLRTIGATVEFGHGLAPHEQLPVVVLGHLAAETLGITRNEVPSRLWIGSHWMVVVGVLNPAIDWVSIDDSALVGYDYAQRLGAADGTFDTLYVHTAQGSSAAVAAILPATVYPSNPIAVAVDRPAAVLAAETAARSVLNSLYLGLAAIGVFISGVGIANTLTITVVERRAEIGLRRALGARRLGIATQFVFEGALIALLGTIAGALIGLWATTAYAWHESSPVSLPSAAITAGAFAALLVGIAASLYPAARAAALPPSDALRLVA
jgi:putative ABC transport system permease protein